MEKNILSYLDLKKDISFSQLDFNEYDGLIFARISYVRFPKKMEKEMSGYLKDIATKVLAFGDRKTKDIFRLKEDHDLLEIIITSKRYENIYIKSFKDEISVEQNEQFYALHFINKDKDNSFDIISYRGTDGTAVGWKEDFDLCYKRETFAQIDAKKFLKNSFELFSQRPVYLVGHSKGGNLAVYAASTITKGAQRRIAKIYTYDSPGFNSIFFMKSKFETIKSKIEAYAPDASVIGRLMDVNVQLNVVKSKQFLLLQHNIYNWRLEDGEFVRLDKFSRRSNIIKNFLDSKLVDMNMTERKKMVEKIYVIINTLQYDGLLSLDSNPIKLAMRLQKIKREFPEFKDAINSLFENELGFEDIKLVKPIKIKKRR